MNRREALSLLKGGSAGIAKWNERRLSAPGERLPSLSGASLFEADLRKAKFSGANLNGANLGRSKLSGADLSRACLIEADLGEADLRGADLSEANLCRANLDRSKLSGAGLSRAFLYEADLSEADLREANLNGADLNEAKLNGADLRGAKLSGADLRGADLLRVDLRGAKLRDCPIFGVSAWNIKTNEETEQINLIISDTNDPIITVDNVKVAQFIYLLLNNEEIRDVIDTITSKAVLILGRFSPERKALLDAVREALRHQNYLPVMFDFDKPASRGYTDTVTTLARMARFIIADLTDSAEVRLELAKIVPDLPSVPVKPLILASQTEYTTFVDIRRYPWVLEPFRYEDTDHAIASLLEMVLAPAEAKVTEVKG
jgi:uncharacterized protein YjbI with pentapeptide repeats